jgi:hypothetical protein
MELVFGLELWKRMLGLNKTAEQMGKVFWILVVMMLLMARRCKKRFCC